MDYLIFAEPNTELVEGSKRGIFFFKQELDMHKKGWSQVDVDDLNLLCVSREVANLLCYPNAFPQQKGLDDIIYHAALMLLYYDKHFFISPRYVYDIGTKNESKIVQNWLKNYSNQELLIKTTQQFIENYFVPESEEDEEEVEYGSCYRYY